MAGAFDELKWRGLIHSNTESVPELLATGSRKIYNGFDATADSLHVGHMVPLLALARLQRFGHVPFALAGGGTSMIGDPSGRMDERLLLSHEEIEVNIAAIKRQLAHFLDFEVKSNPARLINNADWLLSLNLIDFLRDTGKHFTVNYMIAKDSVRARLEREEGLSFTEFSYMLLQSYDFLYLYDNFGITLQTGGSDQWGNITAGAELIRRTRGKSVGALVYPLITKSDGTKFGKTASGAVWLSAERTSPYRFYQFWFNTDDRDVINYLKFFTWLDAQTIAELETAVSEKPEQREAQRRLAREMTRIVHDETALGKAEQASQVLFGGEVAGLTGAEVADIFADVPSGEISVEKLKGDGLPLTELLAATGTVASKGEARRAIEGGGVYLNNRRVFDPAARATAADAIDGKFLVLRHGRKNYRLVRVLEN
ncbi:MAG: tyrosine--tRNA ligase [Acidobacteriota bacterium]|jgi:tyrosyl-tRNA synthetase|nr:tyrosine--tRNA ligase [Acidobacteriota bacterium]